MVIIIDKIFTGNYFSVLLNQFNYHCQYSLISSFHYKLWKLVLKVMYYFIIFIFSQDFHKSTNSIFY